MSTRTVRFLSRADLGKSLAMPQAIRCVKEAFAQVSSGNAVMPPRQHLSIPEHSANVLIMPSYLPEGGHLAVKLITLCDRNPQRGLPRIQALVILCDAASGTPRAVLDGAALTAIRTGAASGLATDLLARPDAEIVAILGSGVQARSQLEAVCAVRSVREVRVFDLDRPSALAFAEHMQSALGTPVGVAASAREALNGAGIVCCATTSHTPVFADTDLAPGAHVNAIGSYQPQVQEVPAETVLRARVVVDHRESALAETGDLLVPIHQGRYSPDRIHAELGEIVLGLRPGRQSPQEITFFKSVGLAVQDSAAAALALANAERLGLGTVVEL